MKNSMALLAMAASFGPATATFNFGSSWENAGSYTCPGNSNNECKDTFKGGFDWSDLTTGSFDSYNGFNFKGWSCEDDSSKGSKVIKGSCGKDSTPSFGCGSNSGFDKFTVSKFEIDVEFDCRLEFHYSMSDGSTCKQSSNCKKGGNTISNSQCGGATDVQIVFPDQDTPKTECEIKIPNIDFDCGDNTPSKPTSSVPSQSKTKTHPGGGHETSTAVVPSKSHPGGPESSSVVPSKSHPGGPETTPESTAPTSVPETTSAPAPSTTGDNSPSSPSDTQTVPQTPITTTWDSTSTIFTTTTRTITSCGPEVPNCPASGTPSTPIIVTETVPVTTTVCPVTETIVPSTSRAPSSGAPSSAAPSSGAPSSAAPSSGAPSSAAPTSEAVSHTSGNSPVQTESQTPITTTWDSTSTIYTTNTRTITSCGPEVPDCPANGTPSTPIIVTETVPVTTTVCPVTETIVPSVSRAPSSGAPSSGSPTSGVASHTSGNSPVQTQTPDTPLPCPDVVPKCLNSWLHLVAECSSNLDVACFCPNEEFVKKTFECLYSYGESDDVIAESVAFFQGICAAFVPENPGIVTGIETITNILTVTGTPVVSSVPYTTIVYETTLTEPCVSGGTTIPGSTTTKTISTEVTIPNISVPAPTATAAPSTAASANPAQPTGSTLTTKPPVGTISQGIPTSTTTRVPIAAGNNVKASLGLGLAAMLFAAAL